MENIYTLSKPLHVVCAYSEENDLAIVITTNMKCVICNSSDIVEKEVDEDIPIITKVCRSCGERYYNREIEEKLEKNIMYLEVIGKVLKVPEVIKSLSEKL